MNKTVQLLNPTMSPAFSVEQEVVEKLLAKSSEATGAGKAKNSSEYVNRLLKWALENYKE